jgi:hypothetical protein
MVTALIREKRDFQANVKKEHGDYWNYYINGSTQNTNEPNSAEHIGFSTMGRKNNKDIPQVEIKLDSSDFNNKIRKQFAAKKQSWTFGEFFLSNSITLFQPELLLRYLNQ